MIYYWKSISIIRNDFRVHIGDQRRFIKPGMSPRIVARLSAFHGDITDTKRAALPLPRPEQRIIMRKAYQEWLNKGNNPSDLNKKELKQLKKLGVRGLNI